MTEPVPQEQITTFAIGLASRGNRKTTIGVLDTELAKYARCSIEMARHVLNELVVDEKAWLGQGGDGRYIFIATDVAVAECYGGIEDIIGTKTMEDTGEWISGYIRRQIELSNSLPEHIDVNVRLEPETITIETVSCVCSVTKETCRYPVTAESLAALATVVGETTRRRFSGFIEKNTPPTPNRNMKVRVSVHC